MEMGIQPGPFACLRRGGVCPRQSPLGVGGGGWSGAQNSLKETKKEVAQGKRSGHKCWGKVSKWSEGLET